MRPVLNQNSDNEVNSKSSRGEAAQIRLLDVSEKLFAEKGFDGTSVREITRLAGYNLASINYYFSNKENLYRDVYLRRIRQLRELRIAGIERVMSRGSEATLEDLLDSFARTFLDPLVDHVSGRMLMDLMFREISEPRLPKDLFFQEMIRPVQEVLQKALRDLCPGLSSESAIFSIHTVVAQLLHMIHLQEMNRSEERIPMPSVEMTAMIKHLVRFSAAGIRAVAERNGNR
jgi:AcrR family transcriptional regulator